MSGAGEFSGGQANSTAELVNAPNATELFLLKAGLLKKEELPSHPIGANPSSVHANKAETSNQKEQNVTIQRKIKPVPGIAPHLWHLHQDKLVDTAQSPTQARGLDAQGTSSMKDKNEVPRSLPTLDLGSDNKDRSQAQPVNNELPREKTDSSVVLKNDENRKPRALNQASPEIRADSAVQRVTRKQATPSFVSKTTIKDTRDASEETPVRYVWRRVPRAADQETAGSPDPDLPQNVSRQARDKGKGRDLPQIIDCGTYTWEPFELPASRRPGIGLPQPEPPSTLFAPMPRAPYAPHVPIGKELPPLYRGFVPATRGSPQKEMENVPGIPANTPRAVIHDTEPLKTLFRGPTQDRWNCGGSMTASITSEDRAQFLPRTVQLVRAWQSCAEPFPRADFLDQCIDEHWRCDVDTNTGNLVPPVSVPDTMADTNDQVNEAEEFRRRNDSSALAMNRSSGGQLQMLQSTETVADHEPAVELEDSSKNSRETLSASKMREEEIPKNPFAPKESCHLRPAEADDLDQIRDIYNREIDAGNQALDTQPLTVDDFTQIFHEAWRHNMPFIVAVAGPPPRKRHDPSEIREKVIGFAYLTAWDRGLAGSPASIGRPTARLHLYVRMAHRRRLIGSCLMDKIMSMVSDNFTPQFEYQYVRGNAEDLSNRCGVTGNFRIPIQKVYLTFFLKCLSDHDSTTDNSVKYFEEPEGNEDLQWLIPLLSTNWGFHISTEFRRLGYTGERIRRKPAWMDMIVFEHACERGSTPLA